MTRLERSLVIHHTEKPRLLTVGLIREIVHYQMNSFAALNASLVFLYRECKVSNLP